MKRKLGVILISFLVLTTNCDTDGEVVPKLLLVSFDGFRASYLQDNFLSNFSEFIKEGVFTKTKPCFTSLTFPNHYSMITGLRPENHGIVGNSMYDKFLQQNFSMSTSNTNNRWWQQNPNVMPIWIANQLGNGTRSSGAVGFVGTMSPICGMKIDRVLPYTDERSYDQIINNITQWFMGEKPINFGVIYFNQPDEAGHWYGPSSEQVKTMLQHCDNILFYLKTMFQTMGLWDQVNIIVTTDHGMADVEVETALVLEKYIDINKVIMKSSTSLTNIYVDDVELQMSIHKNLSKIPHFNVYYRHEVPEEYKYNNNIRIGDIVVLADEGYLIFETESYKNKTDLRGQHGFNQSIPSMQGIFMARGPNINAGAKLRVDSVDITDIYPFMLEILRLPQREVDGKLENLMPFVKNKDKSLQYRRRKKNLIVRRQIPCKVYEDFCEIFSL